MVTVVIKQIYSKFIVMICTNMHMKHQVIHTNLLSAFLVGGREDTLVFQGAAEIISSLDSFTIISRCT